MTSLLRAMRIPSEHLRRPVRTALCAVGWLLPFALGCQLTSADEVDRTPSIARGTGGSDGHDVGTVSDASSDGPADVPSHNDSTTAEVGAADRYVVRDLAVIDARAAIDTAASAIDASQVADTSMTCDDEESPSCGDPSPESPSGW
jgi:hypothetical protein